MEAQAKAMIDSGGFRAALDGEVLVANRDLSALDGAARKRRSMIFAFGCAISSILFVLELVHEWKFSASYSNVRLLNWAMSAISLLATGFPLGLVLNALYPRSNSVRIDRETIEIACPRFGRKAKKLEFRKDDVEQISFSNEGLSWLGLPAHISIKALGREFKCLQGIAAAEASRIVGEFQRLGYHVSG